MVSGVNWNSRSVTVEWFEQGETKGKELPVDQILSLNPDLCPEPSYYPHNPGVVPTANTTAGNRLRLVILFIYPFILTFSFIFLFFISECDQIDTASKPRYNYLII